EPPPGNGNVIITYPVLRVKIRQNYRQTREILGALSAKRTMNTRSARRFYSDFVVDGTLNPLFATEILLGGLNRNNLPDVMFAARIHWSTTFFTHPGIGIVRVWPAFPFRSTMAQCSSRC